jgi:hypothetical protein
MLPLLLAGRGVKFCEFVRGRGNEAIQISHANDLDYFVATPRRNDARASPVSRCLRAPEACKATKETDSPPQHGAPKKKNPKRD